MADNSAIEWTDATWNPTRGCTRISPGCGGPQRQGGCYAETIAARFSDPGQPFHGFAKRTRHGGAWTGKLALIDDMLTLPLRWRKPRRIFVNSMSDLFHENLPDAAIDKVVAVAALAKQHTLQILTKRSERMRAYMTDPKTPERVEKAMDGIAPAPWHDRELDDCGGWPVPHVWLGVSVEDQERADERIPDLEATPAAVRFLSCEPLLGPVDLTRVRERRGLARNVLTCDLWSTLTNEVIAGPPPGYGPVTWVIAGSESGRNARPCDISWVRSLKDQCVGASVPFFYKQAAINGRKIPTPELDGRTWVEFPR